MANHLYNAHPKMIYTSRCATRIKINTAPRNIHISVNREINVQIRESDSFDIRYPPRDPDRFFVVYF